MIIDPASLLANDRDPEGDAMHVVRVGNAVHGTVALDALGNVVFTPEPGFQGRGATFEYVVTDLFGTEATAKVDVWVSPPSSLVQSSEFVVNTTKANDQSQSAVAVLANGGRVTLWRSNLQDGSLTGVYGRVTAPDGTVGTEFQVNSYTSSDQSGTQAAALAGGGFVVVWQSNGQDGGGLGVYGQRYDAAGIAAGSEFKLNEYTSGEQSQVRIAALPDGGFVAVWQSMDQDGNWHGVYGRRFDAAGHALSGEFQVNSTTYYEQMAPAVTALPDGGFVVVWTHVVYKSSTAGEVMMQRYGATGLPMGSETRVSTYQPGDQTNAAVTTLADGGFVVAWESADQDGSGLGIYAQRYDGVGRALGAEFRVSSFTTGNQSSVKLAALADGGFIAVWQSADQDMAGWEVYAQRYDATGRTVGGEFRVNDTVLGYQSAPGVSARSDGGFVITWQSDSSDGSGSGIVEKVYAASGLAPGVYQGGNGADTLVGSSGSDTLIGGAGADTYLYSRGSGADVVDNRGRGGDGDIVAFDNGVAADQLWFQHVGNDLKVLIIGESSSALIQGWYEAGANQVAEFHLSDGTRLLAGQVENLVSAMAGMTSPPAGQLSLTGQQHQQLDPVIAAAWQHS